MGGQSRKPGEAVRERKYELDSGDNQSKDQSSLGKQRAPLQSMREQRQLGEQERARRG